MAIYRVFVPLGLSFPVEAKWGNRVAVPAIPLPHAKRTNPLYPLPSPNCSAPRIVEPQPPRVSMNRLPAELMGSSSCFGRLGLGE